MFLHGLGKIPHKGTQVARAIAAAEPGVKKSVRPADSSLQLARLVCWQRGPQCPLPASNCERKRSRGLKEEIGRAHVPPAAGLLSGRDGACWFQVSRLGAVHRNRVLLAIPPDCENLLRSSEHGEGSVVHWLKGLPHRVVAHEHMRAVV